MEANLQGPALVRRSSTQNSQINPSVGKAKAAEKPGKPRTFCRNDSAGLWIRIRHTEVEELGQQEERQTSAGSHGDRGELRRFR